MFDPKTSKQPKPQTPVGPKETIAQTTAIADTVQFENQVRDLAYQLFEGRGRQDGQSQQDWLAAEQQALKEHRNEGSLRPTRAA